MEEKKQGTVPEELITAEPSGAAPHETPASEIAGEQAEIPGMDSGPAPTDKMIDLSSVRDAAAEQTEAPAPEEAVSRSDYARDGGPAPWERPLEEATGGDKAQTEQAAEPVEKPKRGRRPKEEKAEQTGPGEKQPDKAPRKGRTPKAEKEAPAQGKPKKAKAERAPKDKAATTGAPAVAETAAPEVSAPRDATRAGEEKVVYIDLTELFPFKDHPFGVRNDTEMQSLVESVKTGGVNQPALVRPREGGGYEIIAGHRRQMASELAGYKNMPCIVRNMTDDEAILAMTDDNLRHREKILPTEKALAIQKQYEAIKHQGARGDDAAAGKLSLESVGQRNGMSVKTVQRYLWLNDLVPDLKKIMDEGRLSFTPAVEISRIRPKHQKYIAVSIEGQQSSPSKSQAQKLREMDQKKQLNPDVIDAVLSQEKSKEGFDVIISSAELAEFFGKDKTPREMKDQIMALLGEWKAKQPPELAAPEKKTEIEK